MRILKMYAGSVNERYLDEAVEELKNGGAVIYPTDTNYAIGCDALNNRAVERICRIRDIDPRKHPLSVICSGLSQASRYAQISNRAFEILRRHLPGAFTFVLPAAVTLPKVFKGRKEVGIRIPDNEVAVALADKLGNPILSTTAEWGSDEPLQPDEIALHHDPVKEIGILIDCGESPAVNSTVVDLTDPSSPVVLRQGGAEFEE